MNHHKHDYDGGSPNIPEGVGDRYYAHDLGRDFWYLVNETNVNFVDLFSGFPVLLKDAAVVQGSSLHEIDIPIASGIVEYQINIPNSFASIPPSVTTDTILIYLLTTAQTDFDIQSTATLDGVTTNYLKVTYSENDEKTRTRAKKSGSYYYEVSRSFTITCDDTAPTDADLVLADIVGDDTTFLTITNKLKTKIDFLYSNQYYNSEASDVTLNNFDKIIAETNNQQLTLPESSDGGESIEVFSKEFSQILQGDTENVISYKNKLFTTKGTSGYLQLRNKDLAKLIYRGVDNVRVEPGVKLSDPASLPTGTGNSCSFSYDGVYLAVAHETSPYITIYKRSGDVFTKLSDPASLPAGIGRGCSFSYDGIYLAVVHNTSPYVTIYKRSGDTFTKLSDPASLPAGNAFGCSFSYDGVYLSVAHINSPYVTIYSRSGDTFTKLSDPSSLPASDGNSCAFSYDGSYLVVAHNSSPYITIYSRSENTFTKLSNPASLPAGNSYFCSFSYDGQYLSVAHTNSPYVTVYSRSGNVFTKLSNPENLPAGNAFGCSFSYDNKYLSVAHNTSPYITVYKRFGDNFTKLSDPSSLPSGGGTGCLFSYNGDYLAVSHSSSPYVTIYKNVETANKVWELIQLDTLYDQDKEYMFF